MNFKYVFFFCCQQFCTGLNVLTWGKYSICWSNSVLYDIYWCGGHTMGGINDVVCPWWPDGGVWLYLFVSPEMVPFMEVGVFASLTPLVLHLENISAFYIILQLHWKFYDD